MARIEDDNFQSLAKYIPGGLFCCEAELPLRLLQVSDGFLSLVGFTREELRERFDDRFWEMIDPRDRDETLRQVELQMSLGDTKELEYRILRKEAEPVWVLDKGRLIRTPEGAARYYCLLVDVTTTRQAQEALRLSLERHQIILDQTNDIIFEWDLAEDNMLFSHNWWKKFACEPLTERVTSRLERDSHLHPEDIPVFRGLLEGIRRGDLYREAEVRFGKAGSAYFWCRVRVTAQQDASGRTFKAVGVILDIDDERRRSQKLIEIAEHDTLTGLLNKGTAQRLIAQDLEQNAGAGAALLLIDVDNFKSVNDTMGHLFGDAFLVEVTRQLRLLFRESDVVGRVGGDEFIVYLSGKGDEVLARKKAKRILDVFSGMARIMDWPGEISCSVGIAIAPQHGRALQELYQNADYALYQAKQQGKNQFMFYGGTPGSAPPGSTAVGAVIDSNEKSGHLSQELLLFVFRILYQTTHVETAVHSILELVGRRFDVSRAYIFESTEDAAAFRNTFEWCSEGVEPVRDRFQHVPREELGADYLQHFNEEGIFYCRNIQELPPSQRGLRACQEIKSVLQCAIRNNGEIRGYVGFDDCRTNRFWTQEQVDALTFISEILSIFLLKQRAEDLALRSAEAMQIILDNQNAWIFVIRPRTRELVYLNRRTIELVPNAKAGMRCYEAFFCRDAPCTPCPARALWENEQTDFTLEVYNPVYRVWSSADACRITWKGEDAILLTCHDITRLKESAGAAPQP